jgi:alpha-tubulin suppressor-like RCC1 family protein
LYCWGDNEGGQLGLGDAAVAPSVTSPKPVNLAGVTSIRLGNYHSGAIAGGELYMWGNNGSGQLGDGTAIDQHAPKKIGLPNVKMIALGQASTCALTNDGHVLCWGDIQVAGQGMATSVPTPIAWQ